VGKEWGRGGGAKKELCAAFSGWKCGVCKVWLVEIRASGERENRQEKNEGNATLEKKAIWNSLGIE
jgi:hypothetical protein